MGHRELHGLPQYLRQPCHPRRRRQDRAAGGHRLAVHGRHHHRLRPAPGYCVPRRQQVDTGRCGLFGSPHHRSCAQEPTTLPVRPDHIRGGHRARPGHAAHQNPIPSTHGTIGKTLHRAESLCGKGWRPEVQPRAHRQRPVSPARLAARRAIRPRRRRHLLARQAAFPHRHLPRCARRPDPHR